MKSSDFSIGDAVRHTGPPSRRYGRQIRGVVMMHDHARGLLKVRWETGVQEWVPPTELLPLIPDSQS